MTTIQWISYNDPVYANSAGTAIDCKLTLANGNVWPFTASSNDVEQHGVDIFNAIIANQKTIPIAPYVAPVPDSRPSVITLTDFMTRFTTDESSAIATAAHTNLTILMWVTQMSSLQKINLTNPDIIASINNLVSAGIITTERAKGILTP